MSTQTTPQPKVVVIGGGTGIYPVTAALKQLPIDISTIVAVSDSGGSTGRIRDEFGFQPVGDLRQSLAALAEGEGQDWIRELLLYRFSKGEGLKGHNLGNLILTALQDMTGSTAEALNRASQIFDLHGTVIPAANEVVDIKILYEDGSSLVGEDYLNSENSPSKKVSEIELVPSATATQPAVEAIKKADLIIIGPGDYFASLLGAILPKGIAAAFQHTTAQVMYISNLMTRHWQTDDMTVAEHVSGIEHHIGRPIDHILINNSPVSDDILDIYHSYNEFPVQDDLEADDRAIRADVIADVKIQANKGDDLHRSFLRHDSQKLLPILKQLLTSIK